VLSGAPSRGFWTECTLIGLAHASAGVPSGLAVAGARHLEELFLQSCMRAFDPAEAMRVHTAFSRVLATAVAVMTTASEEVMKDCLAELGVDRTKFEGRVRFSVQHRLRSERAQLPLMDWSPALSVGIEAIDAQHRQLFSLLNGFHQASTDESDEALLREVVGELIDYTKIHFAFEETLLARHAYPDPRPTRTARAARQAGPPVRERGELRRRHPLRRALFLPPDLAERAHPGHRSSLHGASSRSRGQLTRRDPRTLLHPSRLRAWDDTRTGMTASVQVRLRRSERGSDPPRVALGRRQGRVVLEARRRGRGRDRLPRGDHGARALRRCRRGVRVAREGDARGAPASTAALDADLERPLGRTISAPRSA
jgi:hypothetical protein